MAGVWAAARTDEGSGRIRFGIDAGRPWNFFDIIWLASLTLSIALFAVSVILRRKKQ
jgi:hypothetical protein